MLFTFGCTEVTRAGTGPADLGRELRATAQIAWADPAEFRAVAARPNAICHLGHADTGIPAVLALLRTDETGSDAILIDLVCHLAASRKSAASLFRYGVASAQAAKRRDPSTGSRAFRPASWPIAIDACVHF